MHFSRYAVISVLSSNLMWGSVHAENSVSEEVLVTGQRLSVGSESDEALVSRLSRVPGGTNLVSLESKTQLATLSDLFAYEPGVLVQEFFGGFDQPRLNIRGSGLQSNPVSRGVLLLQDYLPINDADGSFIIGLLQPLSTRSMTIHRGANSRVPDAVTLGGDINMISYTGEEPGGSVRLDSGQDERWGGHINYGGKHGDLDYFLSAGANHYGGFRHHSDAKRKNLSANTGFAPTENILNRTYLNYTDSRFDMPFVLTADSAEHEPESVVGDGDGVFDRLLNIYQRDPHRDFETWRIANRTQFVGSHHEQTFGVYWQKTDDKFVDPLAHTVSDIETTGAQWLLNIGEEGTANYQLGLAWSQSSMPRELYVTDANDGSRSFQFGDLDLEADNVALTVGADFPLHSNWVVDTQLQWVQSSRNGNNRGDLSQLDQDWGFWLPKLGVNYQPTPGIRWYANISASREPPTFNEIVQAAVPPLAAVPGAATVTLNALDEQQAVTVEMGGRGALSAAFAWDVSVYRSDIKDEILSVASTFGVIAQSSNYDSKTVHQGLELALHGEMPIGSDLISYQLTWNYSDFYFENGVFDGNQIAGAPKNVVSGFVNYQRGPFTLGVSAYSQPDDNSVDHANTLKQDSFFLLGLNASYQSAKHFRVYLNLNNALDKNYNAAYVVRDQSTAAMPTFLPGNGRAVNGGVIYSW